VRLAAEATHGLGQVLGNIQLEEEQGQEANVGGEGQSAYLDRLRGAQGCSCATTPGNRQVDQLFCTRARERVNLFSNQLHLLPRVVLMTAGTPAPAVGQRHPTDKGESADIDYLRLLFPACQVAAHRPGPRAAPPSHPTAMGGAHAAICRPQGGFAKQKLYKN
jgi:hypothetical protein